MIVDILVTQTMRPRPTRLLEAFCESAASQGVDAQMMRHYTPRAGSVLMLYGLGGWDRLPHAKQHMASGGHVISWDAGYWERKTDDRKYRVSFDGFHCPDRIMRGPDPGPDRWNESGLSITDRHHPKGDIILVGNGPKSGAVGAAGWAAAKSREIRKVFPGRRIVYRPKRNFIEPDVIRDGVANEEKIEKVLASAALVVCRHSNVAVDACRMSIPVVCDDGAASCIYPHSVKDTTQPPPELRREFLHRLAWWQWSHGEAEAGTPWPWIARQLEWPIEVS